MQNANKKNINITKRLKSFYKRDQLFVYFAAISIMLVALPILALCLLLMDVVEKKLTKIAIERGNSHAIIYESLTNIQKKNLYIFISVVAVLALICIFTTCTIRYNCSLIKKDLEKFGIGDEERYYGEDKFISELEEKFIKIRALGMALSNENGFDAENLFFLTKEKFKKGNMPFSYELLQSFKKEWLNINATVDKESQSKTLMSYLSHPITQLWSGHKIENARALVGKGGVLDDIIQINKLIYIFECATDIPKNFTFQKKRVGLVNTHGSKSLDEIKKKIKE